MNKPQDEQPQMRATINDHQHTLYKEICDFVCARVVKHKLTMVEALGVLDLLRRRYRAEIEFSVAREQSKRSIAVPGANAALRINRMNGPGVK